MSGVQIDAVVMGSSPTGLYAVRELAGAGLSVALVDTVRGCAIRSRHLRGPGRRFVGSADAVARWLQVLASAQDVPAVLVPTSDAFIEFVLGRQEVLGRGFRFAKTYVGAARTLLDKALFHALCVKHGMATPGVWQAPDREALSALADQLPFPCILKPALIHRARGFLKGKKVLLALDADEFRRQVAAIPKESGGWMVQEVIPGPESEITLFGGYVDGTGGVRQAGTFRKLRQHPPGFGSASLVTSQPCTETHELTVRFLEKIGFQGICGAEYKRDPRDGQLKMIEINPRPTLWFQVLHDSGKAVVEAAVRDMAGARTIPDTPQDEAVRWRYALKDAASAWFYRRNRDRFVFPAPDVSSASTMRRLSWPVFRLSDPLPAVVEPFGFLRKAWARWR